jgi:hypothetical protein
MKRSLLSLALFSALALGQRGEPIRNDPYGRPDIKLPSGKSQRDEILRADHKRSQEDAAKLAVLSAELNEELAQSDSHVVSVKMLKKVEDMEKLIRNIRGRLKRN